jgi:hypothetical protein
MSIPTVSQFQIAANVLAITPLLGHVAEVTNTERYATRSAVGAVTAIYVNDFDDLVVSVVSGTHTTEVRLGCGVISAERAPATAQARAR